MSMSTFAAVAVAAASSSSPAAVAASPAGGAGFLWRFKVESVSDSLAIKAANILAVFITGGLSLIYNGTAVYNAFAQLEISQGLFRLYMVGLTMFLMAVEMEFPTATIAWQILLETRAGRGLMHLLLAITLRELPDLFGGGMHAVANSILMLACIFIAAGIFLLCSGSSYAATTKGLRNLLISLQGIFLLCSGSSYAATTKGLRNDAVSDVEQPYVSKHKYVLVLPSIYSGLPEDFGDFFLTTVLY